MVLLWGNKRMRLLKKEADDTPIYLQSRLEFMDCFLGVMRWR